MTNNEEPTKRTIQAMDSEDADANDNVTTSSWDEVSVDSDYMEETAAEMASIDRTEVKPLSGWEDDDSDWLEEDETAGRLVGILALALSFFSLFFLPIMLGAAGIIVGYVTRRLGANGLGNWAIGIGAVSIIVTLFITPFF